MCSRMRASETTFLTSGTWERIKAEEKAGARRQGDEAGSVLDDVPVALPALTRAVKLQSRAARVGFDWPSLAPGACQDRGGDRRAQIRDRRREGEARGGRAGVKERHRGVRRPSLRHGECRAPSRRRSRGLAARRQREIRAPVSQHRGSAPRRGPQARRRRRWKRWTSSGTRPRPRSGNSPLGTPRTTAIISRSRSPCPRASPDAAARRCRYRWCPR